MVKAGSKGPRSILKSHTISRRATVLGRKRETCGRFAWCGPLVIVTACRRRCAVRHRCRAAPAVVAVPLRVFVAPCPLTVFSGVVACHRCCHCVPMHRRHLHCTLPHCLTTPRAVVHCRCTVVLLSCCWIHRHCLPPSSHCWASSLWCHWVPSSCRLHIAGPAAVAIMRWHALYLSRCAPLPSCCVHLHHRTIVCCRRCCAWCVCFMWLVSIL